MKENMQEMNLCHLIIFVSREVVDKDGHEFLLFRSGYWAFIIFLFYVGRFHVMTVKLGCGSSVVTILLILKFYFLMKTMSIMLLPLILDFSF